MIKNIFKFVMGKYFEFFFFFLLLLLLISNTVYVYSSSWSEDEIFKNKFQNKLTDKQATKNCL